MGTDPLFQGNLGETLFPIPSMYGIFTIHLVDFYGFHVGKYTVRPMDCDWVPI